MRKLIYIETLASVSQEEVSSESDVLEFDYEYNPSI